MVRVGGDQLKRASLLEVRLDEPGSCHRTMPSRLGHSAQLLHARTLRQIILRVTELAMLDGKTIQQRERRWVLADQEGKGRRVWTVAVPIGSSKRLTLG